MVRCFLTEIFFIYFCSNRNILLPLLNVLNFVFFLRAWLRFIKHSNTGIIDILFLPIFTFHGI